MAIFDVEMAFTYTANIQVEADSAQEAGDLLLTASDASVTHLQGKSYADISDTTRSVVSIQEIT